MRRRLTFAIAVGLAALIAAAALDAVRGSGRAGPRADERGPVAETEPSEIALAPAARTASWIESPASLAGRLRRNGVRGTLYLSADRCLDGTVRRLRTLSLPELELGEGPRSRTCAFTVSADGEEAAGREAVWSPRAAIFAAETGVDELEVVDVKAADTLALTGSAPAFEPDGALTFVQGGTVVEWSADCAEAQVIVAPSFALGPEEIGPYCPRTLVARDELAPALPDGVRLRSVEALGWMSGSRMLAALRSDDGPWLAGFENGRRVASATSRLLGLGLMRSSPDGGHVAVLARGVVQVYDDDVDTGWSSSVDTRAYDWSPDGEWLAYADDGNVYLARTSDWTTRFSLPVSTAGLAWRQPGPPSAAPRR